MGRRVHRDIPIRGVVYPTVQAAAAALGVSERAVLWAIRNGTLHRCGTGASHPEPMPVRIRGEVFENAHAAAARFGVAPHTVWRAIQDGREDRIGLQQAYNNAKSQPVTLGGQTFPSKSAASRAMGRAPGYVAHVLKRGGPRAREALIGAAMALAAREGGG